MKKTYYRIILFLCLMMLTQILVAQEPDSEEQAVKTVIVTLFEGMFEGNAEKVASVFHPLARLQTTYYDRNNNQEPTLKTEEISEFVEQIRQKPATDLYEERILSYHIQIDDNLAAVWTPYQFYYNGQFSHCGVNAFQLVRTTEGWKIIQVTDTRRRENCQE